jgi:Fe-S oxidoreductase
MGNVVWHDSCYLGRYHDIYEQPRDLIEAATGRAPTEMDKHHKLSFCCGGGGGGMWMEENEGERINIVRSKMAVEAGADTVCTACPFCRSMFMDGVKGIGKDEVKVKDISHFVLSAIMKKD